MSAIDEHVSALLKTREELEEQLRKVKAMIEAAGVSARRKRESGNGGSKRASTRRRGNGIGVSPEKVEAVFNTVQSLGVPTATADIAAKVDGLGQSAVGKVLSHLVKEHRVRHAGFMPGVKGKRPLYAPWPSDRSATSMGAEPHELPGAPQPESLSDEEVERARDAEESLHAEA